MSEWNCPSPAMVAHPDPRCLNSPGTRGIWKSGPMTLVLKAKSLTFLDAFARHGGAPRRQLKPGTVLVPLNAVYRRGTPCAAKRLLAHFADSSRTSPDPPADPAQSLEQCLQVYGSLDRSHRVPWRVAGNYG
jgi:hypothetical protein